MGLGWAYPWVMLAATLAGLWLSWRDRQRLPLSSGERLGLAIGAFCGAMLGAKLPFALADWEGFRSGTAWFDDGKTIMLGLVGGYLGVETAKWSLDVRAKTGDSFAVAVPVAVAVGRLACFCGPCCYGVPTALPWGVDFLGDGPRHPTQLYESAFHFAAACALGRLRARGLFRGQLIKLHFLSYFVYRFGSEFLRPEPVWFAGLTAYQWAALGWLPVFAALWIKDARATADDAREPGTAPSPSGEIVPANAPRDLPRGPLREQ